MNRTDRDGSDGSQLEIDERWRRAACDVDGSARRVFRRLSAWFKKFLPDFEKATYELRRYAGSRVLDVTGNLVDTQRFLRHRDIKTTMEWYAYRMQRAAALPMAVAVA